MRDFNVLFTPPDAPEEQAQRLGTTIRVAVIATA